MDKGLERVREFHQRFGIDEPDSPQLPSEPVLEQVALYATYAAQLGRMLKAVSAEEGGSTLLIRLQLIQEG